MRDRSIPTCVGQPSESEIEEAWLEVYPHVCGAAGNPPLPFRRRDGLSPRVWGSLRGRLGWVTPGGSIPTCVGQPHLFDPLWQKGRVYPHVCGAAPLHRRRLAHVHGLSPRVWGSRYRMTEMKPCMRSIPTCVGQPYDVCLAPLVQEVYPHVCGAAHPALEAAVAQIGLSPRVWGSRRVTLQFVQFARSIPTCVGQPWPEQVDNLL